MKRSILGFARHWLHCTPSEAEDRIFMPEMRSMQAAVLLEAAEMAWSRLTASEQVNRLLVAQKLRQDEGEALPDVYEEFEEIEWRAMMVTLRASDPGAELEAMLEQGSRPDEE